MWRWQYHLVHLSHLLQTCLKLVQVPKSDHASLRVSDPHHNSRLESKIIIKEQTTSDNDTYISTLIHCLPSECLHK